MWDIISSIGPLAIAYAVPMMIIALGGLFSERSGVVNIALEGLMGVGAFAAAVYISIFYNSQGAASIWLGLLIAALAGGVFSLIHAFASITMKADQVISGTAINILSAALTVYLSRTITGRANIEFNGLIKQDIPVLSKIPVIGDILFSNVYATNFLVFAIFIISAYIIYKTRFGLRLRACGENPHAADSMGINVIKMRYIAVFISGLLAGLGGGIIMVTYSKIFSESVYNGVGFLALAALIFGKWNPWGVLGASLFFGLSKTVGDLSSIFEGLQVVPKVIFTTFPYVMTLIALVLFSKNSSGPRAAGEAFDKGKR